METGDILAQHIGGWCNRHGSISVTSVPTYVGQFLGLDSPMLAVLRPLSVLRPMARVGRETPVSGFLFRMSLIVWV